MFINNRSVTTCLKKIEIGLQKYPTEKEFCDNGTVPLLLAETQEIDPPVVELPQRSRKRKRNPTDWRVNKRKAACQSGQSFVNNKKKTSLDAAPKLVTLSNMQFTMNSTARQLMKKDC